MSKLSILISNRLCLPVTITPQSSIWPLKDNCFCIFWEQAQASRGPQRQHSSFIPATQTPWQGRDRLCGWHSLELCHEHRQWPDARIWTMNHCNSTLWGGQTFGLLSSCSQHACTPRGGSLWALGMATHFTIQGQPCTCPHWSFQSQESAINF